MYSTATAGAAGSALVAVTADEGCSVITLRLEPQLAQKCAP